MNLSLFRRKSKTYVICQHAFFRVCMLLSAISVPLDRLYVIIFIIISRITANTRKSQVESLALKEYRNFSTIHPTSFHFTTSHKATRQQLPIFFLFRSTNLGKTRPAAYRADLCNWAKAAKAVSTSAAASFCWVSSSSSLSLSLSSSSLSCAANQGTEASVAWKIAKTTGNAMALPAMSVRKLCVLHPCGKVRAFVRYGMIGKPW